MAFCLPTNEMIKKKVRFAAEVTHQDIGRSFFIHCSYPDRLTGAYKEKYEGLLKYLSTSTEGLCTMVGKAALELGLEDLILTLIPQISSKLSRSSRLNKKDRRSLEAFTIGTQPSSSPSLSQQKPLKSILKAPGPPIEEAELQSQFSFKRPDIKKRETPTCKERRQARFENSTNFSDELGHFFGQSSAMIGLKEKCVLQVMSIGDSLVAWRFRQKISLQPGNRFRLQPNRKRSKRSGLANRAAYSYKATKKSTQELRQESQIYEHCMLLIRGLIISRKEDDILEQAKLIENLASVLLESRDGV